MAAKVLDGREIAERVRAEVAKKNAAFQAKHGRPVGLVAVRVGEDPASEVYVRGKRKAGLEAGLHVEEHHLDANISQADLLLEVETLNDRSDVDAILVQLPLPRHINPDVIISAVSPEKDVDGFHPVNAGLLATGRIGTRPCTPLGCLRLLEEGGVKLEGANAVVVGRSNIVGKPIAFMLLERHCTVTIAHSRTRDLAQVVGAADIVIAAVGKARMIHGDWIKPGAAVIDVGINRLPDGKLTGDVDFDSAVSRAGVITPVPKGVGPMTIAMLLQNAVEMAERRVG